VAAVALILPLAWHLGTLPPPPANGARTDVQLPTRACLDSGHPQAAQALRDGITATPALRLRDELSGQPLLLLGPLEGDALVSALDPRRVRAHYPLSTLARQPRIHRPQIGARCLPIRCSSVPRVAFDWRSSPSSVSATPR